MLREAAFLLFFSLNREGSDRQILRRLFLDEAGLWKWRYESTGIVDSAQQGSFEVAAEDPVG